MARRLAKLANSPFMKVEASKFTEVGYVGRDVESMIRDLVDISIDMVRGRSWKRSASARRQRGESADRSADASTGENGADNEKTREKLRERLREANWTSAPSSGSERPGAMVGNCEQRESRGNGD